jgi:putative PIG3 family NAD(P)H quinone oxidoreductase
MALTEVPDPEPGPGEVLVEVVATAVNRADIMQRRGHYPPPPGTTEILGLECSGRVSRLGPGVERWSVGAEVCALLTGGGYAESVAVPAGQLMPVPDGLDLVTAAALPEVVATVWSNLVDVAGLRSGDVMLVHGGASGVGTMAIQVAKALGATVAITAGSPEKVARCRELGADVAVNYNAEDFVEVVRRATDGHGADVVLDTIGAAYLERNLAVLATGGRVVTIGLLGGRRGELDLGLLLAKRGAWYATSLRMRPPAEKARVCAEVVEHVWPLVATGVVRPVVHALLPLTEAEQAHRMVEASEHVGKVLLQVR